MARFATDEATYVRTPPTLYKPLLVNSIVGGGSGLAVQVVGSDPGSVPNAAPDQAPADGCMVVNTGSTIGYYSPYGVATADDIPFPPGAVVTLPVPSLFGLSIFAPAGITLQICGYSY